MKNKTSILPLLFLGLVLAGCSRTKTDSTKVSSNNQPDPNAPVYSDKAADADKKAVAEQSQVAALPTPAPTANTDTTADAQKSGPDYTKVATDSTLPSDPVKPTTLDASLVAVQAPKATPSLPDNLENFAKPTITARVTEWKLSADDIKSEFEAAGIVERSKTIGAGEPTGPMDAALATLVTGKLQADEDLAALKLAVTADKGVVALAGNAKSLAQIGKAVAIALDTEGATQAISTITIKSE